jgi:lysophospholipase L1-like esterase
MLTVFEKRPLSGVHKEHRIMGRTTRRIAILLVLTTTLSVQAAERKTFADPARFDAAIAAFETADSLAPPPAGSIVCTGSSSMRGWHKRLAVDLAPLTVTPRGFGGSNYYDLLHHADRVILAYEPRAVLLYSGDNDVAAGIPATQIHETFMALVTRLRGRLPALRIYVIGAKPSIARWNIWPQMVEANALIRIACEADPALTYIDVSTGMLQSDGMLRPEIFREDVLHMNDLGYDAWAQIVGPVLRKGELDFE